MPNLPEKIAKWADEFSTDAFREMLAIICKWRSSKKYIYISEFKKMSPRSTVMWHNIITIQTFQTCMCVFVDRN